MGQKAMCDLIKNKAAERTWIPRQEDPGAKLKMPSLSSFFFWWRSPLFRRGRGVLQPSTRQPVFAMKLVVSRD
jgi:hypothetical protein